MEKQTAIIKTPIGYIEIETRNNTVIRIHLFARYKKLLSPPSLFTKKVITQLKRYFDSPGFQFSLPLSLEGTPFQKRVWKALRSIPTGKTMTYGELAKKLKTNPRAIGNACRANPIPILIPCHRIISQHDYGGFGGALSGEKLDVKCWLLRHETIALG